MTCQLRESRHTETVTSGDRMLRVCKPDCNGKESGGPRRRAVGMRGQETPHYLSVAVASAFEVIKVFMTY